MSTRPRLRGRPRPPVATGLIGTLLLVALTLAVYLPIEAQQNGVPIGSFYRLHVELDNLANLARHNEVRIAGRRVGQVLDPRIEHGRPVVTLELDRDVEPLRLDTTAVVRSKGLLGARFLELHPGHGGRPLADGATIPARQASATVELHDVLSAFDRRRRRALGALIDASGAGTLGRGRALNDTVADARGLVRDLGAVSAAVTARPGAAARFFPSLESAAAAAEPVREAYAQGFEPGARALRPLGDEAAALASALVAAPPALHAARRGLARTDPLLVQARGVAHAAIGFLDPAPAALRETRALLAAARTPLARTRTLLRRVRPAVPDVVGLARTTTPVLPRLETALRDGSPPLAELASRPCDVLRWGRNWRSMLGFGVPDRRSPLGAQNVLRLEFIAGAESLAGLARSADHDLIGRNPYPAPCEAGTERLP